jgi:hypothetical protein
LICGFRFGSRGDRSVDTGNLGNEFLRSFEETPEINDPVPSEYAMEYFNGFEGLFFNDNKVME